MMHSDNESGVIHEVDVAIDLVQKKLDKLREDKAPGPDGLSLRPLYQLKDQLQWLNGKNMQHYTCNIVQILGTSLKFSEYQPKNILILLRMYTF